MLSKKLCINFNLQSKFFFLPFIWLSLNSTSFADNNFVNYRVAPYYSSSISSQNNIPQYTPWTTAVSPNNVWWIPLEYGDNQMDAIKAIIVPITFPDGWLGYDVLVGAERQELDKSEFELAQAVGKVIYKIYDSLSSNCTATHIGNRYVVTAGHCIDNGSAADVCKSLKVEWALRRSRTDFPKIPESTLIGKCEKIISWNFTAGDPSTIDHAIFRVDVAPEAKIEIEPKPDLIDGSKLHQFSHPGGLPLVMDKECSITRKTYQYYQHNCWGASGSSGSALVDATTHRLLGVLSMGNDDTFFSVRNDVSPIGRFDIETGEVKPPE